MTDAADELPTTAGHYAERVTALLDRVELRDGTTAWVGPLLPGDAADLAREYQTLSSESKRHRFLSAVPELSPAMLKHFVDKVDGIDHVAIVMFAEREGELVPAGIARIVRYPQLPDAADIAVTVKDDWQGRGVASALLPMLVARRPPGVTHILTEVAEDNVASLAMLQRIGKTRVHRAGSGVLDIDIDLIGEDSQYQAPPDSDRLHPVLEREDRRRLRTRDREAGV